jgi:hypothetical protein
LVLFVSHTGGKYWRFRYSYGGKERVLSVGEYPAMGLARAREERDVLRGLVREGRDPAIVRRAGKARALAVAGTTFERTACDWHGTQVRSWTPRHADDVIRSLERDVFPEIGDMPLVEITAPVVLALLRKVEARSAIETAHRLRQRISAVFQYAIGGGIASMDPASMVD